MTARNPITGDLIASKPLTDAYRDNWDAIFGKRVPKDDTSEKHVDEIENNRHMPAVKTYFNGEPQYVQPAEVPAQEDDKE